MTFRWYIWGRSLPYVEMLDKSILSFQRFFDKNAKYIVCCDDRDFLSQKLSAEVDEYVDMRDGLFWTPMRNFKQLAPQLKLTDDDEILVDADIFCIREPRSLFEWIKDDSVACIQSRTKGSMKRFGFGEWDKRIDPSVPPCCFGFLGMKGGFDFSEDLMRRFFETVSMKDNYFNDQGAVIKSLEAYILSGRVTLLTEPSIRYFTPQEFYFDVAKDPCEMVHCIGGYSSSFFCFKKLVQLRLI